MSTLTEAKLPETSRAYHHGDLRSALIEAGMTALETTDPGELSLRQLAREVGVSATAVYRHFPDKRALLAALAEEGLAMLGESQRVASEAAGGGNAGFAATGRAYVRFAIDHPGLFRLIYTHTGPDERPAMSEDNPAAALLRDNVKALSDGDEGARVMMVRSWAIAHGLAMLILDGHLPADDGLIEAAMPSSKGKS